MDNIRFILIVSFAMILLLLYQAWEQDYDPKPVVTVSTEQPVLNTTEDLPISAEQTGVAVPNNAEAVVAVNKPGTKIITVKTDVLALEIDTEGGTIRSLDLLKYPVEKENTYVNALRKMVGMSISEKNLSPVRLFNSDKSKLFMAQSGLIASNGSAAVANHQTLYTSAQDSYELQPGQDSLTVPFTWTDNNGIVVTKSFVFKRNSYEITLDQKVKNDSGKAWSGFQYNQLLKIPDTEKQGGMLTGGMRAYDGGVVFTDEEKLKKIDFDDMAEKNDVTTKGGWTGMIQHYFATAWIPPSDQENHFFTKALQDGRFIIGSSSSPATIENNAEAQFSSKLFAGPKIQPMMEKIATGLELTVDYSVLTFIGKPIYWLLNQIHGLVGNWGLAIIGVTLCIKLLFFKLSQSSFQSMAKMRKIQPRLKELQERFASDRQRFNVEMMALYKKEKVNPLGGCLPILIQIPVFMALYWVLSETVEFRHSPFILWIQDLSAQDPFYILPVIMGISMKIQQGLNPAPIDPIQAKVMKMFPIVFTVFFLFFPAGLVLYWVINNTLSIIQQSYITKKIAAEN